LCEAKDDFAPTLHLKKEAYDRRREFVAEEERLQQAKLSKLLVREGVLLHNDAGVKGEEGENERGFPIATVVDFTNPAETERVGQLRLLHHDYLDSCNKAREGFSQQMMTILHSHNFIRPVNDVSRLAIYRKNLMHHYPGEN